MNEMNYSPIPVNYYQQYAGGQDFRPVTTTTRKSTKPIVVNREDLVTALAGASDEYKKALEESNTLMGALGKAVSDEQVAKALAAPTNKGRLESKMGGWQAVSGGILSGLNTYGKLKQIQENKAAKEYEDALKMATMTDALKAREEAADLQNAVNNQTITVTGMEKYNLPKDGSGSNSGIQTLRPLDSTLGDRIRENPDAFGFTARVADRDTNGDLGAMITSSFAKGWQGDENLATRGQLLQEVSQVVGAVTSLQRASGTAAGMMNSDKEGQRALAILSNPSQYSSEELAAAVDTATRMYDNALRFSGKYEQVYGVKPGEEQSFPTGAQTTIPVAQQKVSYAGTKTDGGYAW
jgi:hypothetical protein